MIEVLQSLAGVVVGIVVGLAVGVTILLSWGRWETP
jgi:hypothetical protein